MEFKTRKPSGKASFPLLLLAGVEAGGKTWAAVEASAMEEVDRTFFIEVGESTADEYGAVPGADYEIVEHDGTIGQIREAISLASAEPAAEGKYNLLIIDSATEIWTLLSENAQEEANRRARNKGKSIPEDGARITMDLWNQIKETWNGLLGQCRRFPGPVIITARLELVTAMDDKGQPTKDKFWKIQAEKNLGYNVQVVLQARQPREWTLTKIVTTNPELQLQPGGARPFKQFSVAQLLRTMGVHAGAPVTTYVETRTDGEFNAEVQAAREAKRQEEEAKRARKQDLVKFADQLLAKEAEGDLNTLRNVLAWAEERRDPEKIEMCKVTIARLEASAVEAEIVPEEGEEAPAEG